MSSSTIRLYLDGIQGEATLFGTKGWIEVLSFSFGQSNSGVSINTGVSGGTRVSPKQLDTMIVVDKSYAPLLLANSHGRSPITGMILYAEASSDKLGITWTFGAPQYVMAGTAGSDPIGRAIASVTFQISSMKWTPGPPLAKVAMLAVTP